MGTNKTLIALVAFSLLSCTGIRSRKKDIYYMGKDCYGFTNQKLHEAHTHCNFAGYGNSSRCVRAHIITFCQGKNKNRTCSEKCIQDIHNPDR